MTQVNSGGGMAEERCQRQMSQMKKNPGPPGCGDGDLLRMKYYTVNMGNGK